MSLEFLYFIIFYLNIWSKCVSDTDRINFSQALSLKLISRQRVGCPVSSILCIFHRVVQPPKNLCGIASTCALRKLSSPDDWYGFRSPYFAPPIAIRFLIYLPPVALHKNAFSTLLWRSTLKRKYSSYHIFNEAIWQLWSN